MKIVIFFMVFLFGPLHSHIEEQKSNNKCLSDIPARKEFPHKENHQKLRILTFNQTESRLVSTLFSILTKELLGHQTELVLVEDERQNLDLQFSRLSNCEDARCNKNKNNSIDEEDKARLTQVSLDIMLPPSEEVDTWGLLDIGQLGPAVSSAWLVPHDSLFEHWEMFKSEETARQFQTFPEELNRILKYNSDCCSHSYCNNGIFEPPYCSNKTFVCATLLTGHPGNTARFNSSLLFNQIISNNLLVRVVFLCHHLNAAVSLITNSSAPPLILHHYPSLLATKYKLKPIIFPSCQDPLLFRQPDDTFCLYSPRRLAKIIWHSVLKDLPTLYDILKSFSLDYSEYNGILQLYAENEDKHTDEDEKLFDVACLWLNNGKSSQDKNITWLENQKQVLHLGEKPKLYIGGIFPISGNSKKFKAPELADVALMAVNDINNNNDILPDHQLELLVFDGQCKADIVMKRFIDIIKTKDSSTFQSTVGVLGPACSDTVEPIAGLSKHYRMVVISYSAEGSISSDSGPDYPYFFRTIAENNQYKFAYVSVLQKIGWKKVAALTQEGQMYSDYVYALQVELQKNNIQFVTHRKFPSKSTDMKMYLKDLKQRGARIIIGDFFENAARLIICDAFQLGMTQKEGYVWFLPGWYADKWFDIDSLKKTNSSQKEYSEQSHINMYEDTDLGILPNCSTQQMLSALTGHLSLFHEHYAPNKSKIDDGRTVGDWKKSFQSHLKKTYKRNLFQNKEQGRMTTYNIDPDPEEYKNPDKNSGYVYDAVTLYAKSLHKLIEQKSIQNLHSKETVSNFVEVIKTTDFNGVSGRINFNNRQSRLSNIDILQWYQENQNLKKHQIGLYKPDYEMKENHIENNSIGRLNWDEDMIQWHTLSGIKPEDDPKECGALSQFATYLDIDCQLAIVLVMMKAFAVLLLIVLVTCLVQKRRFDMKVKATENRMRALGLLSPLNVLILHDWEIPKDRIVVNRKLGEGAFGTVFGGEFFTDHNGWVAVAVKSLKNGSSADERIYFLSEAEMMKRFEHKNIIKLIGVCTKTEIVYMVIEFMLYGDLKTYLLARRNLVNENDREDSDEVSNRRLTSMALDIASGLAYLGDQKYVHRDLACRNCLVNSVRTVKLADFGMTRLMYESDYYRFSKKGLLPVRWMSPESLTDGLFTPKSDIWSYGVLLYEMITFGSIPFPGLTNSQVLVHIKSGNTLPVPQGINYDLRSLLRKCWSHDLNSRPNAGDICELFQSHPRLVSPSIDRPTASAIDVTSVNFLMTRTDSIEIVKNKLRIS